MVVSHGKESYRIIEKTRGKVIYILSTYINVPSFMKGSIFEQWGCV